MAFEVRARTPAGAQLGEAPMWLPSLEAFLWLDLYGRRVHRFDPLRGENRVIASGFRENLACLVRATGGQVLMVTATRFLRLDPDSGATTALARPLIPARGTAFNDGKVALDGSLWLGTADPEELEPTGALYRVGVFGVECIDRGFVIANGPAFSPDARHAYFADTVGRSILRYTLDAEGRPVGRAPFVEIPEEAGFPDGITTDRAGRVYSAHYQGGRISVYDPEGNLVETVRLPADNVTSCAFGGHDGSLLCVTTAAREDGMGSESPHGDVFVLSGDAKGSPEPEFNLEFLES